MAVSVDTISASSSRSPAPDDVQHNIRWIDTGSYGTWTSEDHFTSLATESDYHRSFTQPAWGTGDRLLGTAGMYLNMWTWKLGTGHGYTYPAAQWWFGLQDPRPVGRSLLSPRPGTGGRPQRQRALQDPALRAPRPLARNTAASSSGSRSSTGGSTGSGRTVWW